MCVELSRKYSEHINNLVESVERVSYALFVHEPGHAGHLYIYIYIYIDRESLQKFALFHRCRRNNAPMSMQKS